MVNGLVWFGISIFIAFVTVQLGIRLYVQGFSAGMRKEAKCWIDAIQKVTPPNWQSLPLPEGLERKTAEEANKVYAAAFKVALEIIKEEIAVNRLDAIVDDITKGTILEQPTN
jgi:hypothetical protein